MKKLNELRYIVRGIISENRYNLKVDQKNGEDIYWNDDMENSLNDFIEDGNVINVKGGYKTQDAQYSNLLPTKNDLRIYFYKEFLK